MSTDFDVRMSGSSCSRAPAPHLNSSLKSTGGWRVEVSTDQGLQVVAISVLVIDAQS
jgi:hypothetical protein